MTDNHTHQVPPFYKRYAAFILTVLLPTLLAALYLFVFAADQYVSEARFTVRQGTQSSSSSSVLGMVFGSSASALSQGESYAVADYLVSHDAVKSLRQRIDLVGMFRRPEADAVMRLWWSRPPAEKLLDYFQRQVTVSFDTQSGMAVLRVRAFRPEDAEQITENLLDLGEKRVNDISTMAENDTLRVAQSAVTRAEQRVSRAQSAITDFRLREQALDPTKSATTLLSVVSGLESQLAAAQAQLQAESTYLGTDSPQYRLQSERIKAIEMQIDNETSRLTGKGSDALAPILSQYEQLELEREFADKEYTVTLATMETARVEVMKQHLFVARIVEPNLPEESTYPKRFLFIISLFCCLLLLYSIGWLIFAGVKEHTA